MADSTKFIDWIKKLPWKAPEASATQGNDADTHSTARDIADSVGETMHTAIMASKRDASLNPAQQAAQDTVMSTVSTINPVAGQIVKFANDVQYLTNSQVDAMTKKQADFANASNLERWGNNFFATMPATFLGATVKAIKDSFMSQESMEARPLFADSVGKMDIAQTVAGKNILFGHKDMNTAVARANRMNEQITDAVYNSKIRDAAAAAAAQDWASASRRKLDGQTGVTPVGKEGMKFIDKNKAIAILNIAKSLTKEDLQAFQNGGVIGVDTNILPEGALHKNKNHLEDVNPEIGEKVTEKGIPVIVTDKDGKITQVAEIESDELVFSKSITMEIEKLWKEGTEEAMIKAGKLLAKEVITNTQDNTGGIENG